MELAYPRGIYTLVLCKFFASHNHPLHCQWRILWSLSYLVGGWATSPNYFTYVDAQRLFVLKNSM